VPKKEIRTAIVAGDMALRMEALVFSRVYRRTCVVVAMGNAKRKPPRLDLRGYSTTKPVSRNSYLNTVRYLLIFFIPLLIHLLQQLSTAMTTASRLLCGRSFVPAQMGRLRPAELGSLAYLIEPLSARDDSTDHIGAKDPPQNFSRCPPSCSWEKSALLPGHSLFSGVVYLFPVFVYYCIS
jgi:hypothetical protein